MKTRLLPNECEFCGEKEIKEESISGTFYRCLRCGMVHGELHDKNNEYRQAWYKFQGR
ncbi:MAG: hypothetical protein HXL18_01620 [Peptostreptococcus sp.]|jgi:hypothetical protein|nr:hypothetical protein [Peptostreptococcus sp.]DAP58839.1 MAG TPA: transcription factor [Caudoviricetes sp.]